MSLVAVTGWGQIDDRRKAIDAGVDQHMVKPVDMSKLIKVLASVRRPAAGPGRGSDPGPALQ
jgi:DNA-binding response OmpR family regulator